MAKPAAILVVDDQSSFRFLLKHQLCDAGFSAVVASSAEEALLLLEQQPVDLILSDLVMPGLDGLAFLSRVSERFSNIPFVIITAHGCIASAVDAMKLGAFDYVEKHCSPDELLITIRRALKYQQLLSENEQLKQQLKQKYCFQNIVTSDPDMKHILELAASVSTSQRTTVALFGESGCGKEILAQAIHFSGGGLPANFVGLNCAAIPEMLLESELFGHVRGAFTGADRDRDGKFTLAKEGTILLDEIGDMPMNMQAKLLRVLEDRVFEKVGSNKLVAVDCRVIVATNRNLFKLVQDGQFREDLYHRINVFPITIPPLRERRVDIPILADYFINILRNHLGKPLLGLSQNAMSRLLEYDWPGNVRELRNCLERAAIIVPKGELIRTEHLSIHSQFTHKPIESIAADNIDYLLSFSKDDISLEDIINQVLAATLERCGGNKTKAAAILKVNRKMFYR